jgi:hypothetical protein
MADSGLVISWGETYPGREEQALRLWKEGDEFYASLLEGGRISRFEPFLVAGRGAPLRGFMIVGGTLEQIGALTLDDEWTRSIMRLEMCCKDVCVNPLNFGERLDHVMELWEHEVSALA